MKQVLWSVASALSAMVAAMFVRKMVAAIWPGEETPPLNPADRKIGWQQALGWAALSGLGAGVARTMSRRVAAAGWEAAFGETPPGVEAA